MANDGKQRICDTCSSEVAKYCCPRCGRRSCCLACVQRHKEVHECTGKRDCTAFVSVSDFTDSQLLSDYHFLEDVNRVIGSVHRDRTMTTTNQPSQWGKNRQMKFLRGAASKRGIKLILVSPSLSLHCKNTSRVLYNKATKTQTILWRVHLVFPHCQMDYNCQEVCEEQLVSDLLERFIHPTKSDPVIRHKLRPYVQSGGLDSVSVFMRVERNQHQTNRFYLFDKHCSLGDNLRGKTVLEYPTLHIVMADSISMYPVVSNHTNEKDSNNGTAGPANSTPSLPALSMSIAATDVSCTAASSSETNDSGFVQCPVEAEKSYEEVESSDESHKLTVVCAVEQSDDRDSSVWSDEGEGEMESLRTAPNALQMIATVYDN